MMSTIVILLALGSIAGLQIVTLTAVRQKRTILRHVKVKYVIDTSALIDGRVFELNTTGFIDSKNWVILDCVLQELKDFADSNGINYRSKKIRAKEALKMLAESRPIFAEHSTRSDSQLADNQLVIYAKENDCTLISLDKNLLNQAQIAGVSTMSLDELRIATLPVLSKGDTVSVEIIAKAPTKKAAIGLLEWGEPIFVQDSSSYIGMTVECEITNIHFNSLRRNLFAKRLKRTN